MGRIKKLKKKEVSSMRKIIPLLVLIMFIAAPVLADINQNANIKGTSKGENKIQVSIKQNAYNTGSGNIDQRVNVLATGNFQSLDQDNSVVVLGDLADVNSTLKGINLITVDLEQYGNNSGSGNTAQGIDVLIENNVQILDQDASIVLMPWLDNSFISMEPAQ